ncbi:MAG TPA: type II CAAX endopeptidase family protein [Candidatus Saccharimonadales bacterium]|jgi:hypothetical protein
MSNASSDDSAHDTGERLKPVPVNAHKQHQAAATGKVPWGPWTAVLYAAAVYFVAQIAASLMIAIYPRLKGWSGAQAQSWLSNSVLAQFWFVLFAEALTFGAIWWFVRTRHARLRSIGWRKPRWWDPVYTLAGFAVYIVAYLALVSIAQKLFPSLNVNQKQDLGFQNPSGAGNLTLTFISLVVLPPLVEETVFRGFMFTGLKTKLRWGWAALLTSALFAVPHLLESGQSGSLLWVAGIDTFTLSLVLCYLREKTDSLWPGILLHALKNGIAFAALYVLPNIQR